MNRDSVQERGLIVDYLKEYENYSFGMTDVKTYASRNLKRAEKLWELCPEKQVYHLMKAAALIRLGRKEEGEAILKKYERNHVLQFRNSEFRACFLYLAALLTEDAMQRKNIAFQLQKLYSKNPKQPSLYWYLVQVDDGFEKKPEKKLAFLEKQWKMGCKQNLLYIEVIRTLREHPDAAGNMEHFLMQCYIWAQRRRVITKDMGMQIAKHAMKLKSCEKRYEYLLKECYRIFSTKELLAALCSLYIRAGRTDKTAAQYYSAGVEFEIQLNNLYEYYMMSTTEQKNKLLPDQVLLYFLYHDTLNASQRAYLYKNIISFGDPKTEIYEKYIGKIEKYTVDSLLKRRISPEHAYLYEHVLYPNIFTKEMAEAMADLMFLRKLTCDDVRIRSVEVSYGQLKGVQKAVLKKKQNYVQIYAPTAVVTLIDDVGNQYRNTVPYKLEKMFDEKKYIDVCKQYVEDHAGLLLYLCGKKAENVSITEENENLYRQISNNKQFSDEYRNTVLVKLIEYAAAKKELDEIPEDCFETDGKDMTREQRGKMINYMIQRGMYPQAYQWLETYGAVYVSASGILKLLTFLSDGPESETELYYRLCYGCFQNGQMNYISLKYLAAEFLGTCAQMREVWKQAKAFGVDTSELEERILVQMMFTGTELQGQFDIYLSYNQRTPQEYVKKAYLTYMSRENFVKNKELDGRFYLLLEEELLAKQNYAEVCILAYLKHLSDKPRLSEIQKRIAAVYLKEFFARKCYYGYMQKFARAIPEALILEDKVFVEYYASADSEVILNYMIEKDEDSEYQYSTCKLYPSYGGIFSKAITLFEGERITYFITEKKEDGTELSMPSVSLTKDNDIVDSKTKYNRINLMRKLAEKNEHKRFADEALKCRFLEMAAEQLFLQK